MKLNNNTKMANRYGIDLKFYRYENGTKGEPVTTIDFANSCTLDLSSDITWATGGQGKSKMVGFNNPVEGTFTISTQINTMPLLALVTGEDASKSDIKKVTFKNNADAKTNYFVVEGTTLWKDEDGTTYTEDITLHKACISKKYNVSYTGDGDPQSIDVTLELAADKDKNVVTLERGDGEEPEDTEPVEPEPTEPEEPEEPDEP